MGCQSELERNVSETWLLKVFRMKRALKYDDFTLILKMTKLKLREVEGLSQSLWSGTDRL